MCKSLDSGSVKPGAPGAFLHSHVHHRPLHCQQSEQDAVSTHALHVFVQSPDRSLADASKCAQRLVTCLRTAPTRQNMHLQKVHFLNLNMVRELANVIKVACRGSSYVGERAGIGAHMSQHAWLLQPPICWQLGSAPANGQWSGAAWSCLRRAIVHQWWQDRKANPAPVSYDHGQACCVLSPKSYGCPSFSYWIH